jgi:hypothetical protein
MITAARAVVPVCAPLASAAAGSGQSGGWKSGYIAAGRRATNANKPAGAAGQVARVDPTGAHGACGRLAAPGGESESGRSRSGRRARHGRDGVVPADCAQPLYPATVQDGNCFSSPAS